MGNYLLFLVIPSALLDGCVGVGGGRVEMGVGGGSEWG
jgi:hypothetical protein